MTNPITGKTILLGVTGSIAAYKAADLASKLKQAGANVDVVLTDAACKFIQPLTFQSVTGRKAYTDQDLWGGEGHVTHIGLGHAADLIVIAPASANTIAKLAHGLGDNLLSVAVLASGCPMIIAPAMDAGMYDHITTRQNAALLNQRGVTLVGPAAGHLASGLVGVGRMSEPAEILGVIRWKLGQSGALAGKKVVVTAGGTQEAIDPVRMITNRSSGKQGYAVAQAAIDSGAEVVLISAPTALTPPTGCRLVSIRSAQDMLEATIQECADAYALIMAAAVADFRPTSTADQKIKKEKNFTSIELEKTQDILSKLAENRVQDGFPVRVIGFAAESQDLLKNASAKLKAKRLDMIVANDISSPETGFEVDTNRATFLFSDGSQQEIPPMMKSEVAERIILQLCEWARN